MVLSGPPPGSGPPPRAPQMGTPPGMPPPGSMRGPPPGAGYMPQVRHGQPGVHTGFARNPMMGPMRYGFTPHGYGRRGGHGGDHQGRSMHYRTWICESFTKTNNQNNLISPVFARLSLYPISTLQDTF